MNRNIFQELRDFYLDILNPDRKLIMRLSAVQIDSSEILPLIKSLHSVMRELNGSDMPINDLAQLFIQVHCKGFLSNEECIRLRYNGVNLLPHLKLIKNSYYNEALISDLKLGRVSSKAFLEAVRLYLNN